MFVFYIALFVWPFLAPDWPSFWIGLVILALIVGSYHQDQAYRPQEAPGVFSWGLMSLALYAVGLMVLGGMYPQIHSPVNEEKVELSETISIVSLGSQSRVHGVFNLGYGVVDTSPAYQSMRQNPDGGYVAFITSGDTTLYEDAPDSTEARVEIFTRFSRESRGDVPSWVLYITKEEQVSDWRPYQEFNKIHVPEGTVLTEFKA